MLDEIDRKILFELDLNCRATSKEIGERLLVSRQTVDYRITKLCDSGTIENFHACFSLSKLGYRLYKVYFKLRNLPNQKQALRDYLYGLGNVYWIGESSGSWDLLIGLFYKDEAELFPITNELNFRFSDLIVEYNGHSMIRIFQYPKMFLLSKPYPAKEYVGAVSKAKVDSLDLKIIAQLVHDARCPITTLGERLNTSPQIIKRRVQKLETQGMIFQYRVGVNLKKIGLQLYKAIITLNRYTAADHQLFFEFISQIPALQYFVRNIWTIELELNVQNYEEYEKIIDTIRLNFPNLIGSLDSLLLDSDEWTLAFSDLLS